MVVVVVQFTAFTGETVASRRLDGKPILRRSGRGTLFQLLAVKKADGFHGKARTAGFGGFGGDSFFAADLFEFAGIEPIAAATGAVIHFHLFFGAEEMAFELHAGAARAIAFAGAIHHQRRVVLEMQNLGRRDFVLFIEALEFKRIEPDARATALAGIHRHAPDGELGQFMKTSRTFHRARDSTRRGGKPSWNRRLAVRFGGARLLTSHGVARQLVGRLVRTLAPPHWRALAQAFGSWFGWLADLEDLHLLNHAEIDGDAFAWSRSRDDAALGAGQGMEFRADELEFAVIEPEAGASRTTIHDDTRAEAEQFALQFHPATMDAFAFALLVHLQFRIAGDFCGGLFFSGSGLTYLRQFFGVKPDATTAMLTRVQKNRAGWQTGQFAVTGRTFHGGLVTTGGPGVEFEF